MLRLQPGRFQSSYIIYINILKLTNNNYIYLIIYINLQVHDTLSLHNKLRNLIK
jgi:hypothetical protein